MKFRLLLVSAAVATWVTACEPARPEIMFAKEAGKTCGIESSRVCIWESKAPGRYFVAYHATSDQRRSNNLACLANWSESRQFQFLSGPVTRCRTAKELNIAEAAASACAVPAQMLFADTYPQSWGRSHVFISSSSLDMRRDAQTISCLQTWAEDHGYSYDPPIKTD